jgi:hypothetical protein
MTPARALRAVLDARRRDAQALDECAQRNATLRRYIDELRR